MRKAIFVLLCCGYLTLAYSQPSNDLCNDAQPIELQMPSACPNSGAVSDTFLLDNTAATPSDPFPQVGECTSPGADIWLRFNALGNTMQFTLRGQLAGLQMALFQGSDCEELYPVACASGQFSLVLNASVDRNNIYYLMVSGVGVEDQGAMELVVNSTNFCNTCVLDRQGYFSASPAPVNGTYAGGQSVQMCYTVDRWNAAASNEYLHGLEVDFGPGWDMSTFIPSPPASCNSSGNWDWYSSWTSISSNQQFGPGFAYDGAEFGTLDGNPGNNRGMGGNLCSNIGITTDPVQFCWTITTNDCPEGAYGYFDALDVTTRMLGDGISGSWNQTQCFTTTSDHFLATTFCPDPFVPEISVIGLSCSGECDGSVIMNAVGSGPWDYSLTDTSGILIYASSNNFGPDTIMNLCPGIYNATVIDGPSGEVRTETVVVEEAEAPLASATYELPCIEGEPIQLIGQAVPSSGATYQWTGPLGFNSTQKEPLALYAGTYTLVVSIDGCPSQPFILEVPPVSTPVVAIAEDTIIACPGTPLTLEASGTANSYNWFLEGGNTSLGTESSLTIMPEDGAVYIVNGTNESGCAGTDQVLILVPFQPEVTTDIQGVICPFTETVITASGGLTYQWSTGDTTASISVSPEFTSLYYVTITGEACTESFTINIPVSNSPFINAGVDQTLCQGESAELFATGGTSVIWSTGQTSYTINVTPDTTTVYTAVITDSNGCEHEEEVLVTVNTPPALTILPSDTVNICEGDTAFLVVLEEGAPYWDTIVAPTETTTYDIPGAEAFGCQELGTITVLVSPLPVVNIIGEGLICGNDSTLLIANGQGTFSWSTGQTGDSIYVNPIGTEEYTVTATTANGCSQSASVTVTQATPPAPPVIACSATLDQVIFSWDSDPTLTYNLTIIDGPPGVPSGNDQYIVSGLNPEQTVSIALTAVNQEGCSVTVEASCSSSSCDVIQLLLDVPSTVCVTEPAFPLSAQASSGTASGMGSWSGAGVSMGIFDASIAGAGMHELIYTYSDNGCTVADTATITVVPTLQESMVSCEAAGDSILFSWPYVEADSVYEAVVLTGQEGYFLDSTTFVVTGLLNGDSVNISIIALGNEDCGLTNVQADCMIDNCPVLEIMPDTFACAGSQIPLYVESPAQWDTFSWTPTVGLSCTDCPNPDLTVGSATTTYTVVAINNQGCMDTASVTIYVGEIPDSYIPDDPIIYCVGAPFEICMPDGDVEIWIGPNGSVVTGNCLSIDNMTLADEGNYYAFLRSGGCRFGKFFRLEAAPAIEVESFTDFQTACADSTFVLSVESSNAVSYEWEPAQYLDCPSCAETTGSVPQTATFTLTMEDQYGCSVKEIATVFIDDCMPAPAQAQPKLPLPEPFKQIRFFPNPASTQVTLEMPVDGRKQILLLNAAGQTFLNLATEANALQLPLEEYGSGAYLLKIITTDTVTTEWLLINR
jgi:hypothetical protein